MAINWDNAELVGSVDTAAGEVKVRRVEVQKVGERLDVRLFVNTARYQGPTKQGFLLTPEQASELVLVLTGLKVPERANVHDDISAAPIREESKPPTVKIGS